MKTVVTIMCGGAGTRFWPASVKENPKQFLNIFNNQPLILDSYNRATRIVDKKNIFMITTKHLEGKICEIFPGIKKENMIFEPAIRSTAPCLGLGALYLKNIFGETTIMVVLSADQIIPDHKDFENTIKKGIDFVKNNNALLAVGIVPDYPETGFGYINVEKNIYETTEILKVKKYKEKPDLQTAKKYLSTKKYFWNSGMFIWKVNDFLDNLRQYSTKTYKELMALEKPVKENNFKRISEIYDTLTADSIDYALMEKSPNVFVLPAGFKWDDVGSWLALEKFGTCFGSSCGNVKEIVSINSEGNIFYAPEKLVATMDLKDMIVVDTPNAIMILPKSKSQNVKEFIELLKTKKLKNYL